MDPHRQQHAAVQHNCLNVGGARGQVRNFPGGMPHRHANRECHLGAVVTCVSPLPPSRHLTRLKIFHTQDALVHVTSQSRVILGSGDVRMGSLASRLICDVVDGQLAECGDGGLFVAALASRCVSLCCTLSRTSCGRPTRTRRSRYTTRTHTAWFWVAMLVCLSVWLLTPCRTAWSYTARRFR